MKQIRNTTRKDGKKLHQTTEYENFVYAHLEGSSKIHSKQNSKLNIESHGKTLAVREKTCTIENSLQKTIEKTQQTQMP